MLSLRFLITFSFRLSCNPLNSFYSQSTVQFNSVFHLASSFENSRNAVDVFCNSELIFKLSKIHLLCHTTTQSAQIHLCPTWIPLRTLIYDQPKVRRLDMSAVVNIQQVPTGLIPTGVRFSVMFVLFDQGEYSYLPKQ